MGQRHPTLIVQCVGDKTHPVVIAHPSGKPPVHRLVDPPSALIPGGIAGPLNTIRDNAVAIHQNQVAIFCSCYLY